MDHIKAENEKKNSKLKNENEKEKNENEIKIIKMRKDNEVLVDALRLEFGKRNKVSQGRGD